jgi:hypothetical protein
MAITNHRIEGLIRVPTGGWPLDCTDTAGSFTATIPAGDYYMNSPVSTARGLVDELEYQLNESNGAGPTWTLAGYITSLGVQDDIGIDTASGNWSITFDADSEDLRAILGIPGNITTRSTQYNANDLPRTIWHPDCPPQSLYGNDVSGWYETSTRGQVAPDGTATIITGPKRTVNSLVWPAIALNRLLIEHETRTNESYERFWLDCIQGELSGTVPGFIRWYPDATDSATYYSYAMVEGGESFLHSPLVENWNGYFSVAMPRLVVQS